ncbi:hypothetical protein BXZ70DRAFT_523294 [Cristinia sonorae]|uniref:Uncharacterized protein n=1 Tax=Cristinia sonorae TaxID=1940300 RepID=A0A8K0UXP3_9AGAR|nr:hypothetical protein BXZ70DRAFT_523294 [Cristinia sonorae]
MPKSSHVHWSDVKSGGVAKHSVLYYPGKKLSSKPMTSRVTSDTIFSSNTKMTSKLFKTALPPPPSSSPSSRPLKVHFPVPISDSEGVAPSSEPAAALEHTRTCSRKGCKFALPDDYSYKLCESCRIKGREQQRNAKKARLARMSLSDDVVHAESPSDDEQEDLSVEQRLKRWMGRLRLAGKLPLSPRENHPDADFVGMKRKAVDEAESSAKKKVKMSGVGEEEYQNEEHLCRELDKHLRKVATVTSMPNFVASFTVVADEEEEVNESRVRRVAQRIIREGNVPVSTDSPPKHKLRMSLGQPSGRLEYRCACSDDGLPKGEDNVCGGAIVIALYSTSLELVKSQKLHGEKVLVKVLHDQV